jgi:uncharacterized membrane protein
MLQALVAWFEATPLHEFVLDEAPWAWPLAESLHFMGLTLLAGTITALDLRVLGVAKSIPPILFHRLVPFGFLGLAVLISTGVMFLSGEPDQYIYNRAFYGKLILLVVSALNAVFFYVKVYPALAQLPSGADAARTAKLCAAVSLLALAGIMLCGRMLTFFRPLF